MRNQSVQAWRGVAIIAVLLIHLGFLKIDSEVFLVSRPILNFAVPLFFFFSGYFAKFCNKINGKAVKRLLIPYLFWTVISYGIGEFGLIYRGIPYYFDRYNLLEVFLFGYSSMQMYYLIVLLELVLLTPLIYKFQDKTWLKWICLLSTPMCIIFSKVYGWCYTAEIPYLNSTFIFHLTYYYIGLLAANRSLNIRLKNSSLLFVAFLAIYMGVIESQLLHPVVGVRTEVGVNRITAVIFSLCVIALAYNDVNSGVNNQKKNILTIIGDYSFVLYLSHIQLFRGGYWLAHKLFYLPPESLSLEIIVDCFILIFTITSAFIICKLLELAFPDSVLRWIGIK